MNNLYVVAGSKDQKEMHVLLANIHRIPKEGPLDTSKYSIDALMAALKNDLIRNPFSTEKCYALTVKGESQLAVMDTAARAVRSRNNNVFHYSSYWGSWSRILWHESDRKLQERLGFDARVAGTVEIDLTAINPHCNLNWRDQVQYGNIRAHGTAFRDADKIVGTLPGYVVDMMNEWLTPDTVDKLLHADYLPYIDFEKGRKAANGGFKINDGLRDCITADQYLLAMQAAGGPGILMADVWEAYCALEVDWADKVSKLMIHNGLKEQS